MVPDRELEGRSTAADPLGMRASVRRMTLNPTWSVSIEELEAFNLPGDGETLDSGCLSDLYALRRPSSPKPFWVVLDYEGLRDEDVAEWVGLVEDMRPPGLAFREMKRVTGKIVPALRKLDGLEALDVRESSWKDEDVARLRELPTLTRAYFWNRSGKITDRSLAYVAEMPWLKTLFVWEGKVTNAGVAHLERLRDLEYLDLSGRGSTRCTGDALRSLRGAHQLKGLGVGQWALGDGDLEVLRSFPDLEYLDVSARAMGRTFLTDEGLHPLATLTGLRHLELAHHPLSDDGLRALEGLVDLVDLDLTDTGITDSGLARLTPLTELRELKVRETGVTVDGLLKAFSKSPSFTEMSFTTNAGDAAGRDLANLR